MTPKNCIHVKPRNDLLILMKTGHQEKSSCPIRLCLRVEKGTHVRTPTVFLVVDGSELMRTVTISQLRPLGSIHVLSAANGLEALRELKSQRVDFALSTWNRPVISGLDLLKSMRANTKATHLPFLMITGEMQDNRTKVTLPNP
jgi:CheY-like chemotaxis protein